MSKGVQQLASFIFSALIWLLFAREFINNAMGAFVVAIIGGVSLYAAFRFTSSDSAIPVKFKTGKGKVIAFGAALVFTTAVAVLGSFLTGGFAPKLSSQVESEIENLCSSKDRLQQSNRESISIGQIAFAGGVPALWEEDFGYPVAANADELNSIICLQIQEEVIDSCRYQGGVVINRVQQTWNISIIDWESEQLLAENAFTGDMPGDCPLEISEGTSNRQISGFAPPLESIKNWINRLEQ